MSPPRLPYPPARRAETVDFLHGGPVADPYRWLEDPDSAETAAWVVAQNALTRSALDRPLRQKLVQRLWTLFDVRTDEGAPRGRIVAVKPGASPQVAEIVPETEDKISVALVARGRLVASYLHNASDGLRVFELTGKPPETSLSPASDR